MNESRDPLDDVLRAALRRRDEAAAPADLAARAMARAAHPGSGGWIAAARALAAEPARLRRFRLITQIASVAAIVLIGLFLYVGVHRLADHGNLTLTPGNNYSDTSAVATETSTSSSSSNVSDSTASLSWTIMVGVIALTGAGAAAVIRQSSPFAGAGGMERFA